MNTVFDDTVAVLTPNWRSKAYLQAMAASGFAPSRIFLFSGDDPTWNGPEIIYCPEIADFELKPNSPIRQTAEEICNSVTCLDTNDINSPEFTSAVAELSGHVAVYSGKGGALLQAPAFETGLRFLHVHGGAVPDYRGSTAFYFEYLETGRFSTSAIWLEPEIDTGPLVLKRHFAAPGRVDFDCIVEPLARAATLVDVLRLREESGVYPDGIRQETKSGRTFHIIHPTLKHIALMRMNR